MRVEFLGVAGKAMPGHNTTCVLLNDCVLMDAGTGAWHAKSTNSISDVLLTHSHMDHVAYLCFLTDCRFGAGSLRVHCLQKTADALRSHLFNDIMWPDMEKVKADDGKPFLQFCPIEKMFEEGAAAGIRYTPFPVEHPVPTLGYCLHGERENLPVIPDIGGASPECWRWLAKLPRVKNIVIDASFPDGMEDVARASGHLTPGMLEELLKKNIPDSWRVHCCHIKPDYYDEVCAQIKKRLGERAVILKPHTVMEI